MSDIFREVDEDIRRDQVKKIWDRFGPYVLGLAVLIVIGTAGYRGWEYWQQTRAQATGDRFAAALDLSEQGKHDEAIAALQAIAADGSGSYPVLASFRVATEKAKAGDTAGAVAEFDGIAADSRATLEVQTLARLRAALLLVDTASVAELETRIGDLTTTGNVWRHTAREVLGLAAWRAGDFSTAKKYFDEIVNDQASSTELRQRADLMLTLIKARFAAPPEAAAPTMAPDAAAPTMAPAPPADDATTAPPPPAN